MPPAISAQDEVADLLVELIRINTSNPTHPERPAAEWVAAKLDEVGIRSQILESEPGRASTIARIEGSDASRKPLLIHGHLDVVPGRPEQFAPQVEGDRLVGRGAYDMKGGLAAMMCALKDIADQDGVRVRFVCVPDEESEEIDERSTDAVVSSGLGGNFAITGDAADLFRCCQLSGDRDTRDRG